MEENGEEEVEEDCTFCVICSKAPDNDYCVITTVGELGEVVSMGNLYRALRSNGAQLYVRIRECCCSSVIIIKSKDKHIIIKLLTKSNYSKSDYSKILIAASDSISSPDS